MDDDRDFIQELTELANSAMPFTDIRLEADQRISVRMPTGWQELDDYFPPSYDDLAKVLGAVDTNWEGTFEAQHAVSRPFDLTAWRLRINAFLAGSSKRLTMIIRRMHKTPPDMKDIGLPGITRQMLMSTRGLILICGATRSGKTTTAAAMLDSINNSRHAHVITIEDPIEYVHTKKMAIFSQREVGVDTSSFSEGLEDALRQCPDVIFVGEIRNRETAETALIAGESGHLVIGTIHANSAVGGTQKILSYFNENERGAKVDTLAGCLVGVINQVLLPKADGSGYALAIEVINNTEQNFSSAVGDPEKLQSMLNREDSRKGSIPLSKSLAELANSGVCAQVDVIRATMGMPGVQDQLREQLQKK